MKYTIERFLHVQCATSPTFSPDGLKVAYLADTTGTAQVWRVLARGGQPFLSRKGQPEQLTFYAERVRSVRYAPKVPRLVFGMDRNGDERQQLYLLEDGGDISALTAAPEVIHNFGAWSPDSKAVAYTSNARDQELFDVYVRDLDGGTPTLVLAGEESYSVAAWSPDGEALLISQATDNLYNLLYLLDLKTRALTPLTPGGERAVYASPSWDPGKKGLYLLSDQGREFKGIAYLDLKTKALTYLVSPERDVDLLAYSSKADRMAYATNADGYSEAALYAVGKKASRPLSGLPAGVMLDLRWSPDGRRLAATLSGPTRPAGIWLLNPSTGRSRQLTASDMAGIPEDALVQPELVHYPSFDGRAIPAWFYLPRGARRNGQLPVIVEVHGGPESQSRPSFHPDFQYFVHRGYGVLSINYRGSSGYGRSYLHLDDVEKRMETVEDMKCAIDWLVKSGYSHPRRIVAYGGSYGGFMVLALACLYPDLCAAAVGLYGIANFQTYFETTGVWRRKERAAEYGDPVRDAQLLRQLSPIHDVDKIRAPLLLLHGAPDPIVPVTESEQVVEAYRRLGRSVEYVRFEDEGHGFAKRHNRIRAYTVIADFLERHVPVA